MFESFTIVSFVRDKCHVSHTKFDDTADRWRRCRFYVLFLIGGKAYKQTDARMQGFIIFSLYLTFNIFCTTILWHPNPPKNVYCILTEEKNRAEVKNRYFWGQITNVHLRPRREWRHLHFSSSPPWLQRDTEADWRFPKTNPTACWFKSNQIDRLLKMDFLKPAGPWDLVVAPKWKLPLMTR